MKNFLPPRFRWVLCVVTANLLGLGLSHFVKAQDLGIAYFAMLSPQFPCQAALKVFDEGLPLATAVLWGTFGGDQKCIESFMALHPGQRRTLEVHLSNEACRRNKRCGEGEFLPGLSVRDYNTLLASKDPVTLEAIKTRVVEILGFAKKFHGDATELILSTGLEDNYSDEAYEVIVGIIKSVWPYKIVRSPVGSIKRPQFDGADFIEQHSDKPKFPEGNNCIANLDGTDISFPHRASDQSSRVSWDELRQFVDTYGTRCHVTFLWAAPWQGIKSGPFVAPDQRNFQVDAKDVDGVRAVRRRFYDRISSKL